MSFQMVLGCQSRVSAVKPLEESFLSEKQSGGEVSMSNVYKSCGTGNSKSLGELATRDQIVIWQYLSKIYIALKVKWERQEVDTAQVFLTGGQGENPWEINSGETRRDPEAKSSHVEPREGFDKQLSYVRIQPAHTAHTLPQKALPESHHLSCQDIAVLWGTCTHMDHSSREERAKKLIPWKDI